MKLFHTILLLYLVSLSKGVSVYIIGTSGSKTWLFQALGGNSTTVVGARSDFDVHPCNGSFYWSNRDSNMIYRWSPSSADSTAVVSLDLHQPTSVAVDWSGNNIYFTHRIGENGPSRIEVVSADGRSRRVIVAPLPYTNSADYIYLAFSVSTGRLYYTYNQQILAVDADGQNPTEIYTSPCPTPVVTLALDPLVGTLYWTDCTTSTIRWMDTSDTSLRGNFSLPPTSSPVWIAALNNSFYWTQQVGGGGGYAYRVDQPRSGRTVTPVCVWNSSSITPSAVRVLVDGFICPQQGCAVRNGGCGSLCLTTPTGPSCTCPTGRVINNNNSCPLHPRNFILFSKNFVSRSEIRILSFDLGESPPFPEIDYLVPITVANANANYVSYDVVTNRVYWIEQGAQATPTIKRAYLDGTGLEVFINTSISDPRNLAVDPSSRNLYWVDTDFDAVMVASLNNPTLRTILLVTPDSQPPIGIDLDVTRGYLFWSVSGPTPRIQRSLMDGSNQVYLVGPGGLNVVNPGYVASDSTMGQVYWVDETIGPPEVNDFYYVNGSVGQPSVPTKLGFSLLSSSDLILNQVLDMTVFGQWLYWSDASTGNLQRVSKTFSRNMLPQKQTIVDVHGSGGVCGLAAVSTTLPIVQTGCNSNNGNCAQLCLPTGQVARPTCACSLHLTSGNGQCLAASNQVVLATGTSIIVKQTLTTPTNELWTTTLTLNIPGATALAVNANLRRVYWIDKIQKSIYSANINATMATPTSLISCISEPSDLAMDWAGLNIFWTDAQRRVIEVARATDGSSRTVLAMLPRRPDRLALDPRRGFLYWTSLDDATPTIYQLPMDGSTTSTVFWTGNQAEGKPGSLLVAYRNTSATPDALYWVMNNNLTNRSMVYQLSLEGTSPTPGVILTLNNLTAAIAVLGDFLYYTFSSNRAVTRKSIVDPSVTNANDYDIDIVSSAVSDMQFVSYVLQPDVHKCSVNNGICTGAGSLCLSTGISSGTCLCSPRKAKYNNALTARRATQTYSCNDVSSFLLISTSSAIYYLPVFPSTIMGVSPSHIPLSIGPLYNVSAITYDLNRDRVLWADALSGTVGMAGIYGSPCSTIATLPDLNPASLAYDWKGNNVFLTEWDRFEVELVSGSGVKVLLGDLMAYQDLAMNSDLQVLYFRLRNSTIYNVSLATPTVVNRMYPMSGSASLSSMVYQPSNNALIWVNLNASTIEMFFVANQSVRVIASYVGSVAGLAAVGKDVMWLNTADHSIYRCNQDGSTNKYYTLPRQLAVTDFVGVQDSATSYPNLPCYTSPCTDICLTDNATPETATCSCPAYRTLLPPTNTACSGLQCSGVNQFLCSDRSACIPLGYFCDGIDHCRDASDELSPNCPCSTDKGTKLCSNGSMECRPRSVFCDGHKNCLYGEDESPLQCGCLDPLKFQCYLGGVLQCLYNMKKCDGMPDCDDKSDELNCPTSASTTTVTSTNNGQSFIPISASTYIVISVALVIVIVLVGAAVTWCITSCVLHRRKYYSHTQPQKVEQLSMMNGRVSCISPQQRSDSTSQYSGTSMGTHSTLLAGVHADGASGVKRCTSIDLDNPPPSPITMHRYDLPIGPENGENVSTISQLMPAVPNPSMNFSVADGISDGMSISVSQRNFPVNGPTVHHDTRVLYRRVPGSVYSNGTTMYAPPPSAYQNKYQREPVHFRRDADARSISTISSSTLGTENPEQYAMYDDMMEHDAPPPSPVTELSIPQYTFPANSPSSTSGYLESQF